jgi:hypothetical protein
MSQFISVKVLAALRLGRSKLTAGRDRTPAPPASKPSLDSPPSGREEPSSASRISVGRIRVPS